MIPEQVIHKGILRLHHHLTATKHSSFQRQTMCVGAGTMFAYLEGSAVGHELASYTSHRRIGVND